MKKELILAAILLAVGLAVLPPAVYWVGRQVVGDYASDAGLVGLIEDVWSGFLTGDPAAWLLVASPYVLVQLIRLALHAKRRREDVTDVTNPRRRA